MLKSENLAGLANVATARSNLGLGTAAVAATGDFAPASEATTRGDADTSLTTRLGTEESARGTGDSSLTTALSTAVSDRVVADASLTTSIGSEATTRGSADSSLTTRLAAEETARASVDASLSTAIAAIPAVGSDLAAIEALTGTGYAQRTADNTWALSTPSGSGAPAQTDGDVTTGTSTEQRTASAAQLKLAAQTWGSGISVGSKDAWWNRSTSYRIFSAGSPLSYNGASPIGNPLLFTNSAQGGTISADGSAVGPTPFPGKSTLTTTGASQNPCFTAANNASFPFGFVLDDNSEHRAFFAACFDVSALSDATNSLEVHFGFDNEFHRELTTGALIKYTHSLNSGNWAIAVTGSSGSETANTSVAVAAATKITLGVEWDGRSGQNKIRFYDMSGGAQTLLYESVGVTFSMLTLGGVLRHRRTAGTTSRTVGIWWAYFAADWPSLAF